MSQKTTSQEATESNVPAETKPEVPPEAAHISNDTTHVSTEEEFLEKYGLSPLQLQESSGKSIVRSIPDILKVIDDDITYTLPNRVLIAKKLLSWYTIETPPNSANSSPVSEKNKSQRSPGKGSGKQTYKQLIFQQYYPKIFEIIKFLYVTADDRPRDHLSAPEEQLGEQLTTQKPAYYLALLVELFCEDYPDFKESIQKELMNMMLFALSKNLPLQEHQPSSSSSSAAAAAGGSLAHDTSAMTRADILRALIKCLPDVGKLFLSHHR